MSLKTSAVLENADEDVLRSLADERRRAVLSVLTSSERPKTTESIAMAVMREERDEPVAEIDDEELRSVRTSLYHVHLPLLNETDLVDWERSADRVELGSHPVLSDDRFLELLERNDERLDDLIDSLTDERRRVSLQILEDLGSQTSLEELAGELAARRAGAAPLLGVPKSVLVELHHVHLPRLADSDMLQYDTSNGTVTYEGHPEMGDQLFDL